MPARPRNATAAAKAVDIKAILAGAKLPEASTPVCLRGDLVAEHEMLDRQLEKLLENPPTKFSGDGRGELKQRILDLQDEMAAATVDFRFRGLPRREWHAFIAEYPPRPGDANDAAIGVDTSTFYEALIRKCLVSPVLDEGDWTSLLGSVSDRQFDQLSNKAWGVNRRDVDVPFSRAASRLSQSSVAE